MAIHMNPRPFSAIADDYSRIVVQRGFANFTPQITSQHHWETEEWVVPRAPDWLPFFDAFSFTKLLFRSGLRVLRTALLWGRRVSYVGGCDRGPRPGSLCLPWCELHIPTGWKHCLENYKINKTARAMLWWREDRSTGNLAEWGMSIQYRREYTYMKELYY